MADATLELIVKAQNLAASALTQVHTQLDQLNTKAGAASGSMGGLSSTIKGIALGAGFGVAMAGVSELEGVASSAVETFHTFEVQTKALDAALRTHGENVDVVTATLEKNKAEYADWGQSLQDIRPAVTKLTQAGIDQADIFANLPAIMDLARAKNMDLASAADLVSRAVNGQARGLLDLGIKLPTATFSLTDMGTVSLSAADKANRLTAVIAAVEDAAGGARTATDDSSKATANLSNTWEEFTTKVGPGVESGLTVIIQSLGNLVGAANNAAGALGYVWENWANMFAGKGFVDNKMLAAKSKEVGKYAGEALVGEMGASIMAHQAEIAGALNTAFLPTIDIAKEAGTSVAAAFGEGEKAGRSSIVAASADLALAMKHPLDVAAEIAKLQGALHDQKLVEGLNSGNPAAREAAQNLAQGILDRLTALQAPAYVAGAAAVRQFIAGFQGNAVERKMMIEDLSSGMKIPETVAGVGQAAGVAGKALDDLVKTLQTTSGALDKVKQASAGVGAATSKAAQQIKDEITAAFDAAKAKAHSFFDELHQKNVQAIQDAHDLKNAQIDAQIEALNAGVTAEQKALDAKRAAHERAQLEAAVQQATTPDAQAQAQYALQDFMAQQAIDAHAEQVKAQVDVLNQQKKANDDQLKAQLAAEDKRYKAQVAAYDLQQKTLEKQLNRQHDTLKQALDAIRKMVSSALRVPDTETGGGAPSSGSHEGPATTGSFPTVPGSEGGSSGASAGSAGTYTAPGEYYYQPANSGGGGGGGRMDVHHYVHMDAPVVFDPLGVGAQQLGRALIPGLRRELDAQGINLG